MPQISINVSRHGPLFDGRARHELTAFLDEAKDQVASQSLAQWQLNLDRSIRHPTPYYETQVNVESVHGDRVVNDRGIVYGPWLEGVGSRNSPVTRFPGYASLRRAFQTMRTKTQPLVERVLQRYLERMR